jgi:nucleoside-diphosphate-sugar epimerase
VLRYGSFYGPGTGISLAPDAVMAAPIRKRRFPIVGDGGGVWSHVHIEDAAAATAIAVEHGQPGIYNVVDDDPAPVREWLPVLASALGAKPPRRVPRWLGRLAAGEMATVMMTEVRGASNAKAKRELGWTPHYPSWRQGFAQGLGPSGPAARH